MPAPAPPSSTISRIAAAFRRLGTALLIAAGCSGAAGQPGLQADPLAPRTSPRGPVMFTALAPELTGIRVENRYDDPRMWAERYQEFVYGAIGTGVAIGDYDSDGRPDIYVLGKLEGGRLFRNLGDWKFEDVTEESGVSGVAAGWLDKAKGWFGVGSAGSGSWFQGATFADVNNDGRLDLYVCRFGEPNLLFMNRGDGTFSEEARARGLALSDASGVGAFCDYDRDGWLDVYVQTNLLDVVKSPTGQRDRLFRNNPGEPGHFTDLTERAGIRGDTQGHSAIWWDFDEDGWPDLYVANDFAPPDSLYRNNGDGTFDNVIDRTMPHTPHSSMGSDLGDVDNDGRIDLLVADMAATTHEKDQRGMATNRSRLDEVREEPGVAPQYMRNTLFLNTGTGRMLEAAYLAGLHASDWTWSVRLEDLDNDGRLDAIFTNGMVRELNNVDLVARTTAAESVVEQVRIMRASPPLSQSNLAFRNLGNLEFAGIEEEWGLNQRGVSFGEAFGDLDGDGDLDIVHVNYEGGATVLRNDSDTGNRLIVALRGTASNRFGVGARVRLESRSGVQVREHVNSRGYLSGSEPVLHFGLGSEDRITRLTVTWPSGAVQTFGDISANQRLTITEPPGASRVKVLPAPAAETMFTVVGSPRSMAAPDPRRAAADFNQDGRIDEFVGAGALPGEYPRGGMSALYSDHDGTRVDVTATVAPALADLGMVAAALWSDVDRDGWADLIVATEWGHVRLFRNAGGRRLEERTAEAGLTAAGKGRWSALAATDFNGDGRPDIVAGNLGLNTRYRASPEEPAVLLLGDFGSGRSAAIEGYYENGALYPWLSRGEMAAVVPGVRRRFTRNDVYARTTLPEILGEESLSSAIRFEATELRSGVFLSQPGGGFRFEPLARIAQIAPARGIAVADFNGDGHADIHIVQNLHTPPPSVGHFSGGLSQLLLGDGQGGFAAVPAARSGLVVPGEAAATKVVDLDGDGRPDVVVALGDGESIAFRNSGAMSR